MSTLVVDYGMESSFHKSIKKAKSELNKRVDDYENIENRARNIPSNTNNCSNCAYYVKKKYQQIQGKINKLNALDEKVDTFIENVKDTDKRVASRIKKDTKSFKKRTGIGKTSKSIWASICEGFGDFFESVRDIIVKAVDWIKEFYEQHKFIINIIIDVVAIAAAVATGGIVGAFFAIDAACDLYYDILAAHTYYGEGNEAEAERLAGKGGKDAFMWVGRQVDNKLGTDFFQGAMGVLHTGLSICAIGYSFYEAGSQMLKDLKLDKIKVKSLFNGNKNKIKWGSHFNTKTFGKAMKRQLKFKKVLQKDVVKLGYKLHGISKINLKSCMNGAKTIIQLKNLGKGIKTTYKVGEKYIKMFKEGNFNPFPKTTSAVTEFYNDIIAIPSGGVA